MPFEALAKNGRISTAIMYHVYILQSISNPKEIYTGYTQDIQSRIEAHNSGASAHTAKFKPWKLRFSASFYDKGTALEFERYLKTATGIAFRNKRLI